MKEKDLKGINPDLLNQETDFTVDWFSHNIPLWEKLLAELRGVSNLNFLEIGPYEGMSTKWLLENILTDASSSITSVDLFDDSHDYEDRSERSIKERFELNTKLYREKIISVQKSSQSYLRSLPEKPFFDFIYIDGSHIAADVITDAVLSWPLLKSNALLAFDDYQWNHLDGEINRPKIAIDAFLSIFMDQLFLLHKGQQVWVRKK